VQDEIDEVCGLEKMPEVADAPLLPTLRAFIKECLRWRPPIPTGVSHELDEDDVYDGCFIPKGTRVHPLEWCVSSILFAKLPVLMSYSRAFSRDASIYPSPQNFNPERWLSPDFPTTYKEPITTYPTIQGFTTFGWGRRICQGATLTQQELVTACGGLAWAFNISCPAGKLPPGDMQVPRNTQESLVIVKPEAFEICVVVRGERAGIIRRLYEESWKEDCLRSFGAVNIE
jgi:cytochrome P450